MCRPFLFIALTCLLACPLTGKPHKKNISAQLTKNVSEVVIPLALPHRSGITTSPLQAPALRNFVTIIGNIRTANAHSPKAKANAIHSFRTIYLCGNDDVHELMLAFTQQLYQLLRTTTTPPRSKDKQLIFLLEENQYLLKEMLASTGKTDKLALVDELTQAIYTAASPTLADYWHRAGKAAGIIIGSAIALGGIIALVAWINKVTKLHGAAPVMARIGKRMLLQSDAHYRNEIKNALKGKISSAISPDSINLSHFFRRGKFFYDTQARTYTGIAKVDGKEYEVTINDTRRGFSDLAGAAADPQSMFSRFMMTATNVIDRQDRDRNAFVRAQHIQDPEYFFSEGNYLDHGTHYTGWDLVDGVRTEITSPVKKQSPGISAFCGTLADQDSTLSKSFAAITKAIEANLTREDLKLQKHGYTSKTDVGPDDVCFVEQDQYTGTPNLIILSRKLRQDGSTINSREELVEATRNGTRKMLYDTPGLSTALALFATAPEHSAAGRFAASLSRLIDDAHERFINTCKRFSINHKTATCYNVKGPSGAIRSRYVGLKPTDCTDDEQAVFAREATQLPPEYRGKSKDGREYVFLPDNPGLDFALTQGIINADSPGGKIFLNLGHTLAKDGPLNTEQIVAVLSGIVANSEGPLSRIIEPVIDQIKKLRKQLSSGTLSSLYSGKVEEE